MKIYLFILFFIPCFSLADTWPSWFTSDDDNSQKWAVFPSYSHNSTYKHILGARFFVYPVGNTGYYTALEGHVNKDLFFQTAFTYKYWRENGDQLDFIASYNGFSEPYYGEGYQTKSEDRKDIPLHHINIYGEYISKIISYLYGGVFFQFDYRKEKSDVERFPLENVVSGGFVLRYDSRNSVFNSTTGEYYQVRSWMVSRMPSPLFLEGDIRLFFPLFEGFVWALRGITGLTFLNPSSYLFRFSLGGPDKLRGYRINRFRGENYYLSQTELRYDLLKWITLVGFFDIGLANDDLSVFPRYSYGGGIRFGLPPDYNKKIRVEVGKGEDQYNIIVSFGHPF